MAELTDLELSLLSLEGLSNLLKDKTLSKNYKGRILTMLKSKTPPKPAVQKQQPKKVQEAPKPNIRKHIQNKYLDGAFNNTGFQLTPEVLVEFSKVEDNTSIKLDASLADIDLLRRMLCNKKKELRLIDVHETAQIKDNEDNTLRKRVVPIVVENIKKGQLPVFVSYIGKSIRNLLSVGRIFHDLIVDYGLLVFITTNRPENQDAVTKFDGTKGYIGRKVLTNFPSLFVDPANTPVVLFDDAADHVLSAFSWGFQGIVVDKSPPLEKLLIPTAQALEEGTLSAALVKFSR